MKTISVLLFLFFPPFIFSQASINGEISAGDSININISSTTPTNFPLIEVLFRAENLQEYPYWGLEKEDLKVFENDVLCKVISLRHLSESEPINISIVLDHSGSMAFSYSEYLEFYDNDTTEMYKAMMNNTLPDFVKPLENATLAVKGFLENFENSKDKIGLFAFDDTVDVQIKPRNDITSLEPFIDSLKPTGSTAFFDAVYLALESLTELEGISVVIALTDGQDNASKLNFHDIISLSRQNEIPVYCIGLGDAMSDTLEILADSTNGYYAYTNKSSALDSIYDLLNRKILAYYLMTYESPNWSSLDIDRNLTIEFEQSDIYIQSNSHQSKLPEAVISYLKEKERHEFQYLVGGLAGGTVLILSLTMFVISRKRKKLKILKIYPNPGDGNIKIEFELGTNESANLIVIDFNGTEVHSEFLSKSGVFVSDLTHLNNGNYVVFLSTGKEKSEGEIYIKQ